MTANRPDPFRTLLLALTLLSSLLLWGCQRDLEPPPGVPVSGGLSAITPADDQQTKMRRFAEQAVIDAWETYGEVLDFIAPGRWRSSKRSSPTWPR